MTIEEKARAFDETLQKAKEWKSGLAGNGNLETCINELFPQLAESEDEKIRKIIKTSLKSYFEGKLSEGTNDTDYAMCLTWLEKKGEQKPAWSEEDETITSALSQLLKDCESENSWNCVYSNDREVFFVDIENWLKSLRPQNNATDEELAQAKKDAYNDALDKIEYHSGEPTFDDGWSAAIWYLKKKNAQPQNTWKPSEEQLGALWDSIKHNLHLHPIFKSLYNDLKKLREELV